MLSYKISNIANPLPKVFVTSIELSEAKEHAEKGKHRPQVERLRPKIGSGRNQKPMKVTLSMCIKHPNPLLFLSQEESSKIRIGVMQVTDQQYKEKVKNRPDIYLPIDSYHLGRNHSTFKMYSLQDVIPKHITFNKNLRTFGAISQNKDILFSKETNSDGKVLYNVPIQAEFTIAAESGGTDINSLCYYCYTFLEDDFLTRNSGKYVMYRPRAPKTNVYNLGPITSENVIENGKIVNSSHVYQTKKEDFYLGDIHYMQDGTAMMGKSHQPSSQRLRTVKIPNIKIKDHRNFDFFSSMTFGGKPTDEFISPTQAERSKRTNTGMVNEFLKKESPISEIYLSRDKQNNCRFFFSVDIENILRQNTNFSTLMKRIKSSNIKEYSSLIKKTRIEEIRISRRRIIKQEIGPDRFETIKYSPTDLENVIAISADTEKGLKSQVLPSQTTINGVGNRQERKLGTIMEIKPFSNEKLSGFRHFMGSDLQVSSQDAGLYEYTVSIKVKDPIQGYIQNKINRLESILEGDNTRIKSSKRSMRGYYTDAINSPANYDKFLNRFDHTFLRKFNRKYSTRTGNFLFNSIFEFVSMTYMLSQRRQDTRPMEEVVNYFVNISSPNTGSPEGIQKVIRAMEGVKNSLNTALKTNKGYVKVRSSKDEATSVSTNIGSESRAKSYTVEKVFKNKFDSSTPKTVGFDYLYEQSVAVSRSRHGLPTVDVNFINRRFDLEVQKYFTSNNPDIIIRNSRGDVLNKGDKINTTKFSYLTPSNIFLETQNSNLTFESIKNSFLPSSRKEMNEVLNNIIVYNKTKSLFYSKSSDSNDKEESMANTLMQAFANSGVTIESPTKVASNKGSKVEVFNRESNSSKIDVDEVLFTEGQVSEEMNLKSSSDLIQTILQVSETDFLEDSNSVKNFMFDNDDGAEKFKKQLSDSKLKASYQEPNSSRKGLNPFNSYPIQIKSLMLSLTNSTQVKQSKMFEEMDQSVDIFKNPVNYGFVTLNYKTIKMVEVLSGFGRRGSAPSATAPRWVKLNESILRSPKNDILICRLVPMKDGAAGIKNDHNLQLPTFNEVFIINVKNNRNRFPGQPDTSENFAIAGASNYGEQMTKIKDLFEVRSRHIETLNAEQKGIVRAEFCCSTPPVYGQYSSAQKTMISKISAVMRDRENNSKLTLGQLQAKIKKMGLEREVNIILGRSNSFVGDTTSTAGGTGGGMGGGTGGGMGGGTGGGGGTY